MNANITDENSTVTITANHEDGSTDQDVTLLEIQGHAFFLPNFFEKFPNIREYLVFESGLEIISENAFRNASQLEYFASYDNPVRLLGPRIFQDCRSLKTLSFIFNQITHIDRKAFVGLENNILSLNLNGNICVNDSFSINGNWELIWRRLRSCLRQERRFALKISGTLELTEEN